MRSRVPAQLIVKDTVEQRIMFLQEEKRKLVLLAPRFLALESPVTALDVNNPIGLIRSHAVHHDSPS